MIRPMIRPIIGFGAPFGGLPMLALVLCVICLPWLVSKWRGLASKDRWRAVVVYCLVILWCLLSEDPT